MEWSDKEMHEAAGDYLKHGFHPDALRRIMTRAVDLAAARGGTMTAEELGVHLQAIYAGEDAPVGRMGEVIAAFTALGARNAVLEAERDAATQLATHRLKGRMDAASEAVRLRGERDAALRRAEAAEARVRQLAIAGQELSAAVDKHVGAPSECDLDPTSKCDDGECRHVAPRYPCSPTCTHDDAALPGHAGMIVDGNPSTASNGSEPTTGHPERVKERSEAFKGDADMCEHRVDRRDTCGDCEYDRGAEAMRAACLEAVQAELQRSGYLKGPPNALWGRLKAAIEGAAP